MRLVLSLRRGTFVLLALRYLPVVTLPEGVGSAAFTVVMFLSQGAVVAVVGLLLVRRWYLSCRGAGW